LWEIDQIAPFGIVRKYQNIKIRNLKNKLPSKTGHTKVRKWRIWRNCSANGATAAQKTQMQMRLGTKMRKCKCA
jgi:hypothetical protein